MAESGLMIGVTVEAPFMVPGPVQWVGGGGSSIAAAQETNNVGVAKSKSPVFRGRNNKYKC